MRQKILEPLGLVAGGFLMGLLLGVAVGMRAAPIPIPAPADKPAAVVPATAPIAEEVPNEYATGWVNDQDEVAKTLAQMPVKAFSQTPAGQMDTAELPKHVYLWDAHKFVTGSLPIPHDQNPTGSCVGFGNARAVERTLAGDVGSRMALGLGDPSEFTLFSEEVCYAGSRVEANGGRSPIPARSDGSNGSWAARFWTQFGGAPKARYGEVDLTNYSASRARSWNNTGVPDHIELICANHKVADAARIVRWSDAKASLANRYGIGVCSSVGFNKPGTRPGYVNPATRDARGVCQPQGTWQHCMLLDGYHVDEEGREWGHIENSWGANAHKGPTGWGSPNTAGFWASAEVINRMLGEGDSWAYSGARGFPRQELDWFAAIPARRRLIAELAVISKGVVKCEGFSRSLAW